MKWEKIGWQGLSSPITVAARRRYIKSLTTTENLCMQGCWTMKGLIAIRYVGIDPSTKTGFVALDENGNVLAEKEITGQGDKDPRRMVTLKESIIKELRKDDVICIEGFSYGSRGRGISFQFGLGHAIRNAMFSNKIDFTVVAPGQLKKFATGKGNASKDNMILPIYKRWGYEHDSDNVRDAYVLSRIGMALDGHGELVKYQKEIIKELR